MPLSPVPRSETLSSSVYATLLHEILGGRWPPNEAAPSERELAATLHVTRHVVREALKRLQQAGLVRIAQGGSTVVLDWRVHAGLDMGFALISAGAVPFADILHDTAVLRRTIGVDAARLCALNASEEQLAAVTQAAADYPETGTLQALAEAELVLWTAIVVGSGNIAYRLALNMLMRSIEEIGADLVRGLNAEVLADRNGQVGLAAAIAARDADTAARLAHVQLSQLVNP
ncbi:FadR/GntR family transcriptional regulator [Mycolicibacterium sarraceniae]|uniref:GntR family transcriptional regulator n=1 Tax=Mycolicibacterium sarraceniae TaxID=1534348 RepID=A0A7I7SV25_9MYCO|nr:GntR family transcriptional regulator [Mycolicibacterium sarraceniae]BBY59686.1 GntR family transcriptional regulator [Mycolicibacterium sarraceniae]